MGMRGGYYLASVAYILYSFVESEANGEGPYASKHATTERPVTSHRTLTRGSGLRMRMQF